MKKRLISLLILLVALLLWACQKQPQQTVYHVEKNGIQYTVDIEAQTITDGTYTYTYTYNKYSIEDPNTGDPIREFTIRYPKTNGHAGTWSVHFDSSGIRYSEKYGWPNDVFDTRYQEGPVLAGIVRDLPKYEPEHPPKISTILQGIFGVILGGLGIAFPETILKMHYAIYVRNPEPTDLARFLLRFGSIALVICGIIVIIVGALGGTI